LDRFFSTDYLRSGRLRLEQERIPIAILNEAFAS
jgi:hypothetical protein